MNREKRQNILAGVVVGLIIVVAALIAFCGEVEANEELDETVPYKLYQVNLNLNTIVEIQEAWAKWTLRGYICVVTVVFFDTANGDIYQQHLISQGYRPNDHFLYVGIWGTPKLHKAKVEKLSISGGPFDGAYVTNVDAIEILRGGEFDEGKPQG